MIAMPEEKRGNFFTELLEFVLVAAIIVIPVRLFVAQPFIVSGASMEPTFDHGQYLIVDELSYRFAPPQRGDVVIFHPPKDPSQYYIKRIIGLPGETVRVANDVTFSSATRAMHTATDSILAMGAPEERP